jgi:hypothetical protein
MTLRIAYADPPYPGMARLYKDDPRCAEVNHAMLIAHLQEFDGWALSTASTTLQRVLTLCPPDVRISPWVKPFASFKPGVGVAYAWEPIIWKPARKRDGREQGTLRDWVSCNITLRRGLTGAKPEAVCNWMFEALGCQIGDEFHDLFPGSGAVAAAWEKWTNRLL